MLKGIRKSFVSIIITTKNEEKNIGRCLESIKKQKYPGNKIEIIVVDNDSNDNTCKIVKNFKRQPSHFQRPTSNIKLFNYGPERSAQRNYGIKKARGKYILFLDADMSLLPNVIKECASNLQPQTSNLVGLYIPERILGDSYWCKVRDFERSFYNGTVIDCVRFFPKKVWEKVGGFDEDLTGPEDWDFDKKVRNLGMTDTIVSEIYHNESDFSIIRYLQGKSYYAQSFDRYIKKWGSDDPDLRKQFGFWYRYVGVFTEDGKWKKLVAQPIFSIGTYFLRFLVGTNYLISKIRK